MPEEDPVSLHIRKVFLRLLGGRSTQTFVVLDTVRMPILGVALPLGKFGQRVEGKALEYLHY